MRKIIITLVLAFLIFSRLNAQISVLNENFSGCNIALPNGWQQYSVVGNETWTCTVSGYTGNGVYMNGYAGGNQTNEDWLISPLLDLSNYSIPEISLRCKTKYNGSPIEIYVSTNYPGTGNPNAATWNLLTASLPAMNSDVWSYSQNINLAAYKTLPLHFAFKYTSTNVSGAAWWLDDIGIYETGLTLNSAFLNVGQTPAGNYTLSKTFQFTTTGFNGSLDLNAPYPFEISKDNTLFSTQLNYTNIASGIPVTVYARLYPQTANKVYRDSLIFSYNGNPVYHKLYMLGASIPSNQSLKVASWNMRWFGDPANCNCDTALARLHAVKILKDLNADLYCLQEVVNIQQLASLSNALGANYHFEVSPFCSGASDTLAPLYPGGQKLAYIYNTDKIENLGSSGLLASTFPADTLPYYCFASGRFPFIMKAKILLSGNNSDTVIFANLHGKAGSTLGDYNRRQCAAQQMTDSLNMLFPGEKIITVGDYNDFLEGSSVNGQVLSPYQYMLNNGYQGITLPSVYLNQSTFVGASNFIIDNIACSPALMNHYIDSSCFIFTETEKYIPDYKTGSSDHFPIMSYFQFDFPNAVPQWSSTYSAGHFTIENPSTHILHIIFESSSAESYTLRVTDLYGKIVFADTLTPSNEHYYFPLSSLNSGMYLVTLFNRQSAFIRKWMVY